LRSKLWLIPAAVFLTLLPVFGRHMVEKYTRRDTLTLAYTATIDDPEYYTEPWTVPITATYRSNDRLKEIICPEKQ
jgi:hypothetical protein